MDPCTTEIHDISDMEAIKDVFNRYDDPVKDLIVLEQGLVSPEEVMDGIASFETWSTALNLPMATRQTRRKAERAYKKARKRLEKQR